MPTRTRCHGEHLHKCKYCNLSKASDHGVVTILHIPCHRYDVLREKLFLEMLKFHVGEGMWAVLSENEQYEKVMQQKLHVRKLRKEGKMEAAVGLPGAGLVYTSNLLALMGHSRAGGKLVIEKEQEMRKVMEDQGGYGLGCFGPCLVVGHVPTLPWLRSRVWVRVRLGLVLALGKGWVGT